MRIKQWAVALLLGGFVLSAASCSSKKDEPKKEESKKEESKKEESKKEEPKKDEPKKDEPKKDEPKKDEPKKDEPKKDEPKKDEPKKEDTATLDGTWTVSGVTCFPGTVATDDKEYKVADYVFRSMIFRDQLDATPSKIKIEGEVVKLISVVDKAEKSYDMRQKNGGFYFTEYKNYPIGKVVSDGKQISLSITLAPFILGHTSMGKHQDANTVLSALYKQNKTLTIMIKGTK